MSVKVDIISEYQFHGSHGAQATSANTGVASKAKQIMRAQLEQNQANKVTDGPAVQIEKINTPKVPKEYGKHSGNIHIFQLRHCDVDESSLPTILHYIDNVSSKLETMQSWDVQAAKHEYSTFKDETIARYQSQYGDTLSDQAATLYLNELKGKSFKYTRHQIRITITCDVAFEGSKLTRAGVYIRELRSKRIYSKASTLLSFEVRMGLKNVTDTVTQLSKTTLLTKGGKFRHNQRTNRMEFVIDFDQLGERFRDTDSY